jgi:hypothetical protein
MEARGMTVRETVDARKTRFEETDLEELFSSAKEVVVAKGKKTLRFAVGDEMDWSAFAGEALGRSGNLRAPTVRVGKRMLVGYSDGVWEEFFD